MIRARTLARLGVAALLVCAVLWLGVLAAAYAAMRQPPERFGAIMSHVPRVVMVVIPFKSLWDSARHGTLEIGDRAPDFTLPILHGNRVVTLSAEYTRRPVVLVFGSYT